MKKKSQKTQKYKLSLDTAMSNYMPIKWRKKKKWANS